MSVQMDLDLSRLQSRAEPDLMWVRSACYLDRHPTAADVKLALEVSDSSLQADLIEKAALYAEANIVEYWIVDVPSRCIHAFRAPRDGQYTERSVVKIGELRSPLEPCTQPLNLADLFASQA